MENAVKPRRSARQTMGAARGAKNDEFYTRLVDIENEMYHYTERGYFQDRTVFLNCDDPLESNFWQYFELNFDRLGLQRLVSTHYHPNKRTYRLEKRRKIRGGGSTLPDWRRLDGNGDFRSQEALGLLASSDIVVTNPPFSLFREYIAQLVAHDKQFVVLGNQNATTYREIWPLFRDGRVWLGATANSGQRWFKVPDSYTFSKNAKVDESGTRWIGVGVRWFTNLDHEQRHQDMRLVRSFYANPQNYPEYDNYSAVEVSKVADIPEDYEGVMGVPITYLSRHNPSVFDIVGCAESAGKGFSNGLWLSDSGVAQPCVAGRRLFQRIFIQRRLP